MIKFITKRSSSSHHHQRPASEPPPAPAGGGNSKMKGESIRSRPESASISYHNNRASNRRNVLNSPHVTFDSDKPLPALPSTGGTHDDTVYLSPIKNQFQTATSSSTAYDGSRESQREIQHLSNKLQQAVKENVHLTNKATDLELSVQSLKRNVGGVQPSWAEAKHLIQLLTQENNYLINHIKEEQTHVQELKELQLTEMKFMSDKIDESEMSRNVLQNRVDQLKWDNDKLQSTIKAMAEDLKQVVPLAEHKAAVERCTLMLAELKDCYNAELNQLSQQNSDNQSQLSVLNLEVSKLKAELQETNRRLESSQLENNRLHQSHIALQTELNAAIRGKVEAQATLRGLVTMLERQRTTT